MFNSRWGHHVVATPALGPGPGAVRSSRPSEGAAGHLASPLVFSPSEGCPGLREAKQLILKPLKQQRSGSAFPHGATTS